ncbi:unnamed protein product [Prorocentrum cordatum]|uniref:Protochlorophyllide reductase n=1 Tax=Prorocentrum cordatum TaxID=2364126 RepID=A0ABN9VJG0_9DINO|nr:unnamed protein product [Polarella glacialis]
MARLALGQPATPAGSAAGRRRAGGCRLRGAPSLAAAAAGAAPAFSLAGPRAARPAQGQHLGLRLARRTGEVAESKTGSSRGSRTPASGAGAGSLALALACPAALAGGRRRARRAVRAGRCAAAAPAEQPLRGKTACVTGASRGIGKGIALGLGEAGATVFVTGRSEEQLREVADCVTRAGGRGIPLICDHADDGRVKEAFEEIGAQTDGKLDILVNNAWQDPGARNPETSDALTRGAKFYEMPLEVWDDCHRVGLRSHYTSSYFAVPLLQKAASKDWRPLICNISAPAAITYFFAAAYGVGKAGSDRLTRDLQVELGPEGIDCISLWPGVVYTEAVQKMYETNDVARLNRVTGGQDPDRVCESPLLTGRVTARFAADQSVRQPPFITTDGINGRIALVAEAAAAFDLRDGGLPGSPAAELYGKDREPAPSLRSGGYLLSVLAKDALPDDLKWIMDRDGPLVSAVKDVKIPFDWMARDARTEDPREEGAAAVMEKALGM